MKTFTGILLWLLLTAGQVVVLIALALGAFAGVNALTGNGDLALGAALAVPILVVIGAEFVLADTPLAPLRLSQNPIFLLPP